MVVFKIRKSRGTLSYLKGNLKMTAIRFENWMCPGSTMVEYSTL
jgi:hypothetical protein